VLKVLIAAGADLTLRDKYGDTARDVAVECRKDDCAALLA